MKEKFRPFRKNGIEMIISWLTRKKYIYEFVETSSFSVKMPRGPQKRLCAFKEYKFTELAALEKLFTTSKKLYILNDIWVRDKDLFKHEFRICAVQYHLKSKYRC